jgi:hypothetical protein
LNSFLAAQQRLAEDTRFDYLLGSLVPTTDGWRYSIEATRFLSEPAIVENQAFLDGLHCIPPVPSPVSCSYAAYANRLEVMEREMKEHGTWNALHPWVDLIIPMHAAPELIAATMVKLDPALLLDGHVMTYPLRPAVSNTPLLPLPDSDHALLFDVLPNARSKSELVRFEPVFQSVFEHAMRLGARVYPIGYPIGTDVMTQARWREQLGTAWGTFLAAKRRYDPDGVLTPGPAIFLKEA